MYNLGIYHVLCPFPGILTVLHSILCNLHSGQRVGRDGGPSLHGLHWACAQPKTSPEVLQRLCFYPTLFIRHWIFKSIERYYLFWSWQVSAGWNVFTLTCNLLNAPTGICYVLFVDKSLRFFACGCETAVKQMSWSPFACFGRILRSFSLNCGFIAWPDPCLSVYLTFILY